MSLDLSKEIEEHAERVCEHCGTWTRKKFQSCWKCGLWEGVTYERTGGHQHKDNRLDA